MKWIDTDIYNTVSWASSWRTTEKRVMALQGLSFPGVVSVTGSEVKGHSFSDKIQNDTPTIHINVWSRQVKALIVMSWKLSTR